MTPTNAAPQTARPISTWRLSLAAVGLVVFAVYGATLAPGLSWANNGADGGDLVTAAGVLGVAHPTGYPTYLLLARLAMLAPIGSLAYRANLLSAACAALAASVTAALVAQTHAGRYAAGRVAGVLAGLALGLAPLVWGQAVIAEAYTLHLLFTAALLWILPLGGAAPRSRRVDWAAGALFGLGLGNHATLLLLLPAWLGVSAWEAGRLNIRRLLRRAGGIFVGALIYIYIPLRAHAAPPINWGYAVNWEGFRWVALAAPYRGLAFGVPPGEFPGRAADWARLVAGEFGWWGLALGLGWLFFGRAARRVRVVTLWLAAASSVFALGYNTSDAAAYLLPAVLCMALWLGLGLAELFERAQVHRRARWLLVGASAMILTAGAARHWSRVDASRDHRAEDFGQAVMAQAPTRALIFTRSDRDSFALLYFRFALAERPDTIVLVEPLLDFDWYRAELPSIYPDLAVPVAGEPSWKAAVEAANARPSCDATPDGATVLLCAP